MLHDILKAHDRRVTIEEIQKQVAEHYNIRLTDMSSARRARAVARPRQVAMYLAKQLTSRSLPEIGRKFGNRDHTTVMHAVCRVAELMERDAELRRGRRAAAPDAGILSGGSLFRARLPSRCCTVAAAIRWSDAASRADRFGRRRGSRHMKFKADRATLLKALAHVQSVVEKRNTIPILANVMIAVRDGKLTLTATDMEIAIVEDVPASSHPQRRLHRPGRDPVRDRPQAAGRRRGRARASRRRRPARACAPAATPPAWSCCRSRTSRA